LALLSTGVLPLIFLTHVIPLIAPLTSLLVVHTSGTHRPLGLLVVLVGLMDLYSP